MMRRSAYGLLDRGNLLDLVRNFVVFEIEGVRPVKKVARYQQFAAANEIVRRSLDLDREQEWRRGLVWHTQGSGKSLTILFAAKKLWHHPRLEQPTILVVIDRDQLQDQMIGQFIRTNTETCRVAASREDLGKLLSEGDGFRGIIVTILNWLNTNEPAREKFELGYKSLSLLWETLHPDPFLIEHEANYLWLSRVSKYYVKAFYKNSASKFETDPADGAKTRELIRQNVDVDQIKNDLPTYVLDTDYLTKIKDDPPDSKALDIEAMLAAELQIRLGEDAEFQPLSERLKRIVQQKRNGTLAGLALLKEPEELTKETVALMQEAQRPLVESFARAAQERSPNLSAEDAQKIAAALLHKADGMLCPGWPEQEHLDIELFRAFTILLAKEYSAASLHARDKDFVSRCIKLLRKASYKAKDE